MFYDTATSQIERLFRATNAGDTLVETDGCLNGGLQLSVIDQVVVFERLLDHQQGKLVQLSKMLAIRQRVSAVRVDGQQNVRVTAPHFSHDFDVPARFDLELDSLITETEVAIHSLQKLIRAWAGFRG
jgi:hypothetical protein